MNRRKLRLALLIALPLAVLLGVAAYALALHLLKQQITRALGESGEVREIHVSLREVDIDGLRIKASRPGWPAEDELRAERVRVTPDLRSLFSDTIVVRSISVEDAALSVLRNRAGVQILPALLAPAKAAADVPAPPDQTGGTKIRIGEIRIRNSRLDFFDATVAARPLHLPLEQIDLRITDLLLPTLDEKAHLTLQAHVASQGKVNLSGELVPANLDADLRLKLAEVPLKLVEPYLFKGKAGEIKRGMLALDLHARVVKRHLNAPGYLTLSQLELGGLAGFTREAAAAWARAKGLDADTRRPVDLNFTLQGDLDDARFSLNDTIYAQGGLAALKLLGLGSPASSHAGKSSGLRGMFKNLFGK